MDAGAASNSSITVGNRYSYRTQTAPKTDATYTRATDKRKSKERYIKSSHSPEDKYCPTHAKAVFEGVKFTRSEIGAAKFYGNGEPLYASRAPGPSHAALAYIGL